MIQTVQFYISRIAAEAVDVDQLKFRARDRDIPNASAETSYFKTGGRCRVTCKLPIAELLEELRDAVHAATEQKVRDDCLRALDAIAEAKQRIGQRPRSGDTFYAG
jgi:hypothetical protein